MRMWERREKNAHRLRGRIEGLRRVACITVDMTDLSTSCAAQIEEIDSSKEVGSSTRAGIRLFKSSAVRFESEVEVGRLDVDSKPGDGDA